MIEVTNDQIVITAILAIAAIIAGYLLKVAIKISVLIVILVGGFYIFTNDPNKMSVEHATDWAKQKSSETLETARHMANEAKSNNKITDNQEIIDESKDALNQYIPNK